MNDQPEPERHMKGKSVSKCRPEYQWSTRDKCPRWGAQQHVLPCSREMRQLFPSKNGSDVLPVNILLAQRANLFSFILFLCMHGHGTCRLL